MKAFPNFNKSNNDQQQVIPINLPSSNRQDNLRFSRPNDFVSRIQQASDSVLSGEDLLKQFQQYGIEIQNIQADESFDHHQKTGDKNYFQNFDIKKRKDSDQMLDYSKLAKLREHDFSKFDKIEKPVNISKNLKLVRNLIEKCKVSLRQGKIKIQQQSRRFRQDALQNFQQIKQAFMQKVTQIKRSQWQEKQNLRLKINALQQTLQKSILQKSQIRQQRKAIQQELRFVKSDRQYRLKQSITVQKARNITTELDYLTQSRRYNNQLQVEYKKQSQILKNLNAQIQELTRQLEQVKSENRRLKLDAKQNQKRTQQKVNAAKGQMSEKNIQNYNRFLQKIRMLEEQINDLKIKQNDEKQQQIAQWKAQIGQQIQQMDEYLKFCENKQKQLVFRERDIERRQSQLIRQIQLKRRQSHLTEAHDEQELQELRHSLKQESLAMRKVQSAKPQVNTKITKSKIMNPSSPASYISQKVLKTSPPKYQQYTIQRKPLSSKHDIYERPSFGNPIKTQTKFSDQLSCRLNKISSSIENQLSSLGFRH